MQQLYSIIARKFQVDAIILTSVDIGDRASSRRPTSLAPEYSRHRRLRRQASSRFGDSFDFSMISLADTVTRLRCPPLRFF